MLCPTSRSTGPATCAVTLSTSASAVSGPSSRLPPWAARSSAVTSQPRSASAGPICHQVPASDIIPCSRTAVPRPFPAHLDAMRSGPSRPPDRPNPGGPRRIPEPAARGGASDSRMPREHTAVQRPSARRRPGCVAVGGCMWGTISARCWRAHDVSGGSDAPSWGHNALDWTGHFRVRRLQRHRTPFQRPGPPRAAARVPTPSPGASHREKASARGSQGTDDRLQRELDHRSRGSGGGPQAPRHVHRLDRRARPAPPGLGGRRQRGRRGAGRLLRHDRRDAAGRRRRAGRRQRPRHPGRPAPESRSGRPSRSC